MHHCYVKRNDVNKIAISKQIFYVLPYSLFTKIQLIVNQHSTKYHSNVAAIYERDKDFGT